jgi:hypothetical protein
MVNLYLQKFNTQISIFSFNQPMMTIIDLKDFPYNFFSTWLSQ